jgi:hypothetical protein
MVRHILQSSGVQIDGMNHAPGSKQLCKRRCEGAATATKITPGLRSRPFNEGRMNECGGLTDLHLFTVLQLVESNPGASIWLGSQVPLPFLMNSQAILPLCHLLKLQSKLGAVESSPTVSGQTTEASRQLPFMILKTARQLGGSPRSDRGLSLSQSISLPNDHSSAGCLSGSSIAEFFCLS